MIGTTLDKYQVMQKVGEGGMATVYRGRHATLGRDVAIKVLHPHLSSSTRNRKRFAREARAIEHLEHENILQIFDYSGTGAEDCYIVTEFVFGETLAELLQRHGRFPSEVTVLVGLSLSRALAYAHDSGILHRDLKPENAMLRHDGKVKLMDFGIARFLDEAHVTMTGALVGSPAYMSPEQAGEVKLDQRSDLFSLGTLLFHLVTGHLPFTGSNASIILRNIIENNRPSVTDLAPTVSPTLADVIERLLQPDPDDRYADAHEVVDDLELALAEASIDPEDPRWSLTHLFDDFEGLESRLDAHLRVALLDNGRAALECDDHLTALRLFNRLLSIDEENQEVLELVQGMHTQVRTKPPTRRIAWSALAAAAVGLGLVLVLTWMAGDRTPTPTTTVTELPEPTPEPEPLVELGSSPSPLPEITPPLTKPDPPSATNALAVAPRTPRARRIDPPVVEEEPEAIAEEPATIEIRVQGTGHADIYVDGVERGKTRGGAPIQVQAGAHLIKLVSPVFEPWEREVEVAPGEAYVNKEVKLVPRPATALVLDDVPGDCQVRLDGDDLGSVDALSRSFPIPEPTRGHLVQFDCPDATHTVKVPPQNGPDKVPLGLQ